MMTTDSAKPGAGRGSVPLMPSSLPDKADVRALLQAGAIFAWSDDLWLAAWGEAEKTDRPDPARPSFYVPDFYLSDPHPWRIYAHGACVAPDGLVHGLVGTKHMRSWQNFDEREFRRVFDLVQSGVQAGQLEKAVPAVFETSPGPMRVEEREFALRALANLPTGLMPYGCWDESGGLLGASPELLFEDDGVEIHTMAVAGTASAGSGAAAMMDDPKECAEHSLVLRDLETQLSGLGPLTRGAMRAWRIGILSHLRTDLRVHPERKVAFESMVRRLHPTPAVGTAPRSEWRTWTEKIDAAPRGIFAAPFGVVLPGGASRCLVGIRHVQWDRSAMRCGAGCGLVRGSNPEREISELRLKLSATRGNLGL